jgi:hypothetical protein
MSVAAPVSFRSWLTATSLSRAESSTTYGKVSVVGYVLSITLTGMFEANIVAI